VTVVRLPVLPIENTAGEKEGKARVTYRRILLNRVGRRRGCGCGYWRRCQRSLALRVTVELGFMDGDWAGRENN